MNKLITVCLLFFIVAACTKADNRRCFKSAGAPAEKEIMLEEGFNKLYLKEKVRYVLVQDTVHKIVLKGGKNLLNFIEYSIVDGKLQISNENTCAFLRSFKEIVTAEIHFVDLINIHFEGTEPLTNEGTLQLNWLTFLIRDGAGSVNLNMKADAVYATISHGWGDFTFTGQVNYANLNVRSNGFCDTYGLQITDSLTVVSNTQGTLKVNAANAQFKAEINGDGDIWYIGNPVGTPILNRYGKGELLKKD
jgi:hypothetical protein